MPDYAAKARKTLATLKRKGQAGNVVRVTTTGGGPSNPNGGTASAETFPVYLVVFPIEMGRVDGTAILAGDFQVICSIADVEIKESDVIECSEGGLTIKDLGRLAPDGTTIFYDMVCEN